MISSLLEEALLLQHIIDDLQDLAMAEAGELRLRREPVEVADLLAQVATAHRAGAEQAGVTLRTRADGGLRAFADPVRLRQAAGNLVSNAVRHTPHGGAVTLHARRDGDHLLIDVADTGTGIAPPRTCPWSSSASGGSRSRATAAPAAADSACPSPASSSRPTAARSPPPARRAGARSSRFACPPGFAAKSRGRGALRTACRPGEPPTRRRRAM
ncbi:hypothetical protein GCM10020001_002090 [Nonomuraea salmonea]